MRRIDVQIGTKYVVKVSGRLVPVTIVGESPHGGWIGRNDATGREIRVRSAARLRRPYKTPDR